MSAITSAPSTSGWIAGSVVTRRADAHRADIHSADRHRADARRADTYCAVASAEAPRTRLRLTRRGRLVVSFCVSLPIVVVLMAMALNGGGATATSGDAVISTVTVAAGESLWSVAATLAPESSTADVVADLIVVNDLENAELVPGQVLVVPQRYTN